MAQLELSAFNEVEPTAYLEELADLLFTYADDIEACKEDNELLFEPLFSDSSRDFDNDPDNEMDVDDDHAAETFAQTIGRISEGARSSR